MSGVSCGTRPLILREDMNTGGSPPNLYVRLHTYEQEKQHFLVARIMALFLTRLPRLSWPLVILLLARMQSQLRERRYQDVHEVQQQSLIILHPILKSQVERCFQQWQKCSTGSAQLKGNNNGH